MIELISATVKEYDVPYEGAYSESQAIGHSDLRKIASCPSRWKRAPKHTEQTASMSWGSLVDSLLFGVGVDRFAVKPDTYTSEKGEEKPWNANSTTCKEWLAANEGKSVISRLVKQEAVIAVNLLRNDKRVFQLLTNAKFQCWLEGVLKDTNTGATVTIRGLVDIVPSSLGDYRAFLADLKTTADGSLGKWWKTCENGWYHAQGALYLDLWNKATGEPRDRFLHVVQENEQPYEIAHRELDERAIRLGRTVYQNAIELYAQGMASGQWKGLDETDDGWDIIEPDMYAEVRAGVVIQDSEMPNW